MMAKMKGNKMILMMKSKKMKTKTVNMVKKKTLLKMQIEII